MKKLTKLTVAALALTIATQCFPVTAQQMAPTTTTTTTEQSTTEDANGVTKTTTTTTRTIAAADRQIIKTYVTKNHDKLPKGFVRTTTYDDTFPATWREKVVVGQPLDEVYVKHSSPLPSEIVTAMPARPEGTQLMAIDGSVILVDQSSRKVLDIYTLE